MTVFDLKVGESAFVTAIRIEGGARERLTALGIVTGAKVRLIAFSLFKSSALIACGAVRVAMRRTLALKIEVAGDKV